MDRCNCWFDAYKALYGECPKFDMTFTACSGTVASVDCADAVPQDTSNLEPIAPEEPTTVAPPAQPTGIPSGKGAKQ